MARIRSVDFLPEIFRTDVNKEFLAATLDQLVQEPKLKQTQGYVGRRFGIGEGFLVEPTNERANYQLEPGVVFVDNDNNVEDAITYVGLLDALSVKGANLDRADRLFASETYSWNPNIDFDKFINYNQYYWLPNGPDSVDIYAGDVPTVNNIVVTTSGSYYNFSESLGNNPTLTLVRGGSYTFNVNQENSPFWIQSQPGVSGTLSYSPNISSRNVLGVTNNGEDVGTVTFNVPESTAQNYFYGLNDIGVVDLATADRFDSINGKHVSFFAGIDGITDLENRTLVFLNTQAGDSADLGWQREGRYDETGSTYDSELYDKTTYLDTNAERFAKFRITYVRPDGSTDDDAYIELVKVSDIAINDKFTISYGNNYSNKSFYKNASGVFEEVPLLTATENVLYYQDGTVGSRVGVINIIDQDEVPVIDVENEILGKTAYVSPNNVTFTNGLKVKFTSLTTPSTYQNNEYYIEGVGSGIKLIPVTDLITPGNDLSTIDYISIKRSSPDLNTWTRSNRWFHSDIITLTAEYNLATANFNNDYRAKRPIIEFDAGLRLYNHGTQGKLAVNVIDLTQKDALSNVNGSASYIIDGYQLTTGSRVIFAADNDLSVRNKVYEVQIIDPDDASSEYGEIILLVPSDDSSIQVDENVVCSSGNTQQNKVFRYTGTEWVEAQQKTEVNQSPLFDVFDSEGYSFSDSTVYPSTTFRGSKLFSYKRASTGINDTTLGFPLTYLNIDNIGDIVFDNNQYTDTFSYVLDSNGIIGNVSDGFVRKYSSRTLYTNEIGWTESVDLNWPRQIFTFLYEGLPLALDVTPRTDLTIPAVKVYINQVFAEPTTYTITNNEAGCIITMNSGVSNGDYIQVRILSEESSAVGYYEVPSNLDKNIFNENTTTLTLGTIRNHFNELVYNIVEFSGSMNGANNIRDLPNVAAYGSTIIQHSAPLAPAAHFLRKSNYDFFTALDYNAKQYEKFKYQILDWCVNNNTYGLSYDEILDAALKDVNNGKSTDSPFYRSDMLLYGGDYTEITEVYTPISTNVFNTNNVYDFTSANTTGLLIYLNNTLLTKDVDYTVANDGPRVEILTSLSVGDIINIREYNSTNGSFVPQTPTKVGLYPKFVPAMYVDNTYIEPRTVIQGHDGSITIGFNDIRDHVLLEFEKRIYNNLKVESAVPINLADVIPGKFRTTDYLDSEVVEILSESLLNWVGWHKIDYKTQNYDSANEWTWNYSTSKKSPTDSPHKGHWRGIYKYYYDTDRPHTHPWEMLGFSEKPTWWNNTYGPAPYTSGNEVLWDDLELGYNRYADTYDQRYARPGLANIKPVDSAGNLISPFQLLVGYYNQVDFSKSWVPGDVGPGENAWRRSSNWPFAIQKLIALTKPAKYFALGIDRDLYKYSTSLNQYAYNDRYRLNIKDVVVASDNVSKHSYLNWIVEYNKSQGILSTVDIQSSIQNIDVRLCYRMAGFTDKNYLKIFIDKSSPNSSNTSLLIPDESYSLLLYKNQPFNDTQFTSVMIQRTASGYAVYGNSFNESYFRILQSDYAGDPRYITVGKKSVKIPTTFTNKIVRVPYGYTFTTINSVVDFLASYGAYLEASGLRFNDIEKNIVLNWEQMAEEFLNWADENWVTGSLINLNPSARVIEFERDLSVIDSLENLAVNEVPLDQNRVPLNKNDYAVTRLDNNFKLTVLNDSKSVSYVRLRSTSFEHLLVLDNVSIFNDLVYQPMTGLRQQRVLINGFTTFDWNGILDAQGFMLNQDNVASWSINVAYNKGDLVKYKNSYWAAARKIQPGEEFDFDEWSKIDYTTISKGLLPNLSNKADQMTKYYNNHVANLESDADLLGLGLTGFRKRPYLESLNLDDISQIQVYNDLIHQKGTVSSANLFKNAEFRDEITNYTIYENWAIKHATYGSSAVEKFIDIELDQEASTRYSKLIEIGPNGVDTIADQYVSFDDIYRQSQKINTVDIFTEKTQIVTDTTLPTAGFVNIDDVDITLFDINDLTGINEQLSLVKDGAYVWVAKTNKYDWNIYRCSLLGSGSNVPALTSVVDNLNGTLRLGFNGTVDLVKNDTIIIKYFNDQINGAHKIVKVQDTKSVIVNGSLAGDISSLTARGIVFKLVTARVSQASDIAESTYANNLYGNDRVWVDVDVNGKWLTYLREQPFNLVETLDNPLVVENIEFGSSLTQGLNNSGAIIGAPGYNSGDGAIFCYDKSSDSYIIAAQLTLEDKGSAYGNAVDMATNWAVVGANNSINGQGLAVVIYRNPSQSLYQHWQYLTAPNGPTAEQAFGTSVSISEDENWIYISAPSAKSVHAYQKITYQHQTVTLISERDVVGYDIGDYIEVDNETQLVVYYNNVLQDEDKYELLGTQLVVFGLPGIGTEITVTRKYATTAVGDGSTLDFTEAGELYTATSIDALSILVDGVLQRPYYDYTYNSSTKTVSFVSAPDINANISLRSSDHYLYKNTISNLAGVDFGNAIKTTANGQYLLVSDPTASVGEKSSAGKTYVYERIVERFVVASSRRSYTARRTINANANVAVNRVYQTNSLYNVNHDYTINTITNSVDFADGKTLTVGDTIDIDINSFQLVQTLEQTNSNQGAHFGDSLDLCRLGCAAYIGVPRDNTVLPEAGSVIRYLDHARIYGNITGTVSNPIVTVGHSIRIDNVDVVFTNTDLDQIVADINNAIIPNVVASKVNNQLRISVVNITEVELLNKLIVMPGIGTAFIDLGLQPFVETQTITSPRPEEYSQFGSSVHLDQTASTLVVSAKLASAYIPLDFDGGLTEFDSRTTKFFDLVTDSGAVYTYDLLPSNSTQVAGKFVLGQQIYVPTVQELDRYGTAIDYTGNTLLVSRPGYDTNIADVGNVVVFNNITGPSWTIDRQQPNGVDATLIDYVYVYDKDTEQVKTYLDFIDPINGKILGAAKQNIDFVGAIDPATYSVKNKGTYWGESQVGKIWWNTTNIRYLEYNQDDVVYSSKNWGNLVPGSSVEVYEWIESLVPPAQYTGDGTVKDFNEYSVVSGVDSSRTITTRYYFWVKNYTSINLKAGKTLSAETIAGYIESPRTSGIPYAAFIRKNVFAIYNTNDYITENSVIKITHDQIDSESELFVEYDLIRENNTQDFLSANLYRKLQDSFAGEDVLGNQVPDIKLNGNDRYGIEFRPRQSFFKNRYNALKEYIQNANEVLIQYPFAELRTFNILSSAEQIPSASSDAWDAEVSSLTELSYQNLYAVDIGYRYLVRSDSNNNGLWTIYQVQEDDSLELTRVQHYDTSRYWDYVDWYASGFSLDSKPARIVDTYSELTSLSVDNDTLVKVKINSNGKWELYHYTTLNGWERVGLEDGTIQISSLIYDYVVGRYGFDSEVFDAQYFDQAPVVETRFIIKAINEELFVGDFLSYRAELLTLIFNYILSESDKNDWLFKTSLIDVEHLVRELKQYGVYKKDNQTFVEQYIQESKPYHVKIKEFLIGYNGLDTISGNVLDYDVPSYYDASVSQFISPILDDKVAILETDLSNRVSTDDIWNTKPWIDWYANHKLDVDSIVVTNGGSGYTIVPDVTIVGEADQQAEAVALLGDDGSVAEIQIVTPGIGYRTTPTVEIGNVSGATSATAVAYMKNDLVRNIKTTVKFDRYEYQTQIVDWEANTVYNENQLVRYNNKVYRAINADGSTASDTTFDPSLYQIVESSTLSGVDRTSGFYVADVNNPGLDLALLIDGIDYPGVQVMGPRFDQNTGFDVGNFDINPYDNIEFGPEGLPTYSESILDSKIYSTFVADYSGILVDRSGVLGVQATADASISGGAVNNIVITEYGEGYSADILPTVTIAEPVSNITAQVMATTDGNKITDIDFVECCEGLSVGRGYLTAPTVTITPYPPTVGVQATATASLNGGASVASVIVNVQGGGYETTPTVTFSDPPTVATARATMTASITNGSVTSCTITHPGNSYVTPPAVTVTPPPASVQSVGTATYSAHEVTGITLITAGNYYASAPTVTLSAPTETGIQATAGATISGGAVTAITVSSAGYLYQSAPTVTITPAAPTAGTTATAVATIGSVDGFGSADDGYGYDSESFDASGITNISITRAGDGYTVAPTVTISAPDVSGGRQATASATISGDSAPLSTGEGYVVNITITDPGSGYTSAPTITIASPDSTINHGSGASATAVLDGDTGVASITVNNGGSNYDILPTVTLSAFDAPTTATATATVSGGLVTGFNMVDNGWGYASSPTVTIGAPDTTPVTAVISTSLTADAVTGYSIDTAGAGYLTAPALTVAVNGGAENDVATGTATVVDGKVTGIVITNAGDNYVTAPTITIDAPTGDTTHGSGATAVATINAATQVASIIVTNSGVGYDIAPTVTVSAPTRTYSRATATATVVGDALYSISITDSGSGYLNTPAVTIGAPSNNEPDSEINGASFIDEYNSHAPEELVPGAIFDTLDMTVRTRPGFDYFRDGHASRIKSRSYNISSNNSYSFRDAVEYPVELVVFNTTTGIRLYEDIHYTVNWSNQTISIIAGAVTNESIRIYAYDAGGANPLYREAYHGNEVGNSLKLNIAFDDVNTMLIVVNGDITTDYVYEETGTSQIEITFGTTYTSSDLVVVHVYGDQILDADSTLTDYTYSYPETQIIDCDGTTSSFSLTGNINFAARENIIVELNGRRLRPAEGVRRTGDATTIDFFLPDGERTGTDQSLLTDNDVVVYIADVRQTVNVDYILSSSDESSSRFVTFFNPPGDSTYVDIYVITSADYSISGTTLTIDPSITISNNDRLAITTFKDIREQDPLTVTYVGPRLDNIPVRELFESVPYDSTPYDYSSGIESSTNVFELHRNIFVGDRLWVTLNGNRLFAGEGFILGNDRQSILIPGPSISNLDVVAITSFSEDVVPDEMEFRLFQDMRGNVAFYRQHMETEPKLVSILEVNDDVIYLSDVSEFSDSNLNAGIFGIVTINGERITYRSRNIENNTLSGLRRGTAGTAQQRHALGSHAYDIGRGNALDWPYDRIWYAQGTDTASDGVPLHNQSTFAATFIKGHNSEW